MYKKLFSTDMVGLVLDTNEWLFGIQYTRNLSDDYDNQFDLLSIGFLCIVLHIAISK